MITVALIFAHAFSRNTDFNPVALYIGTLVADVNIILAIFGAY